MGLSGDEKTNLPCSSELQNFGSRLDLVSVNSGFVSVSSQFWATYQL